MPLKIVLVGHSLEAKCDFANALVEDIQMFKELECRATLRTSKIRHTTIKGLELECVLTPNLNTPKWAWALPTIEKFEDKVLVYITAEGLVNVDDAKSKSYLENEFKKTLLMSFRHFKLKSLVPNAEIENQCEPVLYLDMDFNAKCDVAKKILQIINNGLDEFLAKKPTNNTVEDSHVDNKSEGTAAKERNPSSGKPLVHFSQDEQEKIKVTSEKEQLPDLNSDDYVLFSKALQDGKARSNHVRVNVVGNQGVGKTTLITRLQRKECIQGHRKHCPTEALDIDEITLRCTQTKDSEKKWETKEHGFIWDLNVQRMAEAIDSVSLEESSTEEKLLVKDEDDDLDDKMSELCMGSEAIEEDVAEAYDIHDKTPEEKVTSYTLKLNREEKEWLLKNVKSKRKKGLESQVYLSFWDFAGQITYYTTHQVFMSPNAVYMIVFDLSKDLKTNLNDSLTFRTGVEGKCTVQDSLKFWGSSVRAFTSDEKGGRAPVILVGTHGDKIEDSDAEDIFRDARELLKMDRVEYLKINNTLPVGKSISEEPEDLKQLRDKILELGLGIADEKVQARWIDLEYNLHKRKQHDPHERLISFEKLQKINQTMDCPINETESIKNFLEYMHYRGQVLFFPEAKDVERLIVLEPVIVAKFLNALMRTSPALPQKKSNIDALNQKGIISEEFILKTAAEILKAEEIESDEDMILSIVRMMESLKIIFQYQDSDEEHLSPMYILPSLLPVKPPEDNDEDAPIESFPRLMIRFVDNEQLPPGFYYIFLTTLMTKLPDVSIAEEEGKLQLFNLYVCLNLHKQPGALVEIYWKSSEIFIDMKNYSEEFSLKSVNIFNFIKYVKGAVQNALDTYRYYNIKYYFGVQCPKARPGGEICYLPVQKLEEKRTAMCKKRHFVRAESLWDNLQSTAESGKELDDRLEKPPTSIHIGRLSRHLVQEGSRELAARVRLRQSIMKSEEINNNYRDKNVRRLHVFYRWCLQNLSEKTDELLNLLSSDESYEKSKLKDVIFKEIENVQTGIRDTELDKPPREDELAIASNSASREYCMYFLMLELGLTVENIETSRENNHMNIGEAVRELLVKWKQDSNDCTRRKLLNTMRFLEINIAPLKQRILQNI